MVFSKEHKLENELCSLNYFAKGNLYDFLKEFNLKSSGISSIIELSAYLIKNSESKDFSRPEIMSLYIDLILSTQEKIKGIDDMPDIFVCAAKKDYEHYIVILIYLCAIIIAFFILRRKCKRK